VLVIKPRTSVDGVLRHNADHLLLVAAGVARYFMQAWPGRDTAWAKQQQAQ
jgi:hypothetical protein